MAGNSEKSGNICYIILQAYRVGQKWGLRLKTIILSNIKQFKKNFTGIFLGKFVVKWILKIPLYLAYVDTTMSVKNF